MKRNSKYFVSANINLLLIATLFLFTRLWELTVVPMFSDEAMYLYFGGIITDSPAELFISKLDAKQPLFMWFIAIALKWFSDPLLAGRLVSVLAGLGTLIGVFKLTEILYSSQAALFASLLYIFCPFNLFHERMIFLESLLNCFGVWMVFLSYQIASNEKMELSRFVLLGTLMGLGFLTKATAVLLWIIPVFIFVIYKSYRKKYFIKYFCLALLIGGGISAVYFLAEQGPGFNKRHVFFNNPLYFFSIQEIVNLPWQQWTTNIFNLAEIYFYYLTVPVILVLFLSLVLIIRNPTKEDLFLCLWAVIPALTIVVIAKSFYSRYFLIFIIPLLILAGRAVEELGRYTVSVIKRLMPKEEILQGKEWIFSCALLLLISLEGINFSFAMAKDPMSAQVPPIDRYQYLQSIISGYGIPEGVEFLRNESKTAPIQLLISTLPGNPQDGISVYLWNDEDIRMIPVPWWPEKSEVFPDGDKFPVLPSKYQGFTTAFEKTSNLDNTYFVYPHTTYPKEQFLSNNRQWKRVWQFLKPDGISTIEIYKYANNN